MYCITPAQWKIIDPICKIESVDGQLFFRETVESGEQVAVPVTLSDNPPPVEVPTHYRGMWPLDPRD